MNSIDLAGSGSSVAGAVQVENSNSPNDRIGFACIGVGGQGITDAEEASQFGDVVAICDVDDEKLAGAAEKYPRTRSLHDWRDLFDEMPGSIDAVTFSTPDHSHAVSAAAAMRLGKNALCKSHCRTASARLARANLVGRNAPAVDSIIHIQYRTGYSL
jgi:hypothetical protein